jgi:hypothetical protein
MKWLLAGLLFALGVVLAIGTAALRTVSVLRASKATPERLAEVHWAHLRTEVAARRERLQ